MLGANQPLLKGNKARSTRKIPVPASLKHDLRGVYAIVCNTMELPLPILSQVMAPPIFAIEVFTDAGGHLLSNPRDGVYIPQQGSERPLAASLALPRMILDSSDGEGRKGFNKTTAFESLGFLTTW